MKKKQYERPSTEVVMLQQHTTLLTGSGGTGRITPMGDPEDL